MPQRADVTVADLVRLSRRRWAVPILARMWTMGGARFAELRNGLGISGESLRQTLTWMIGQDWVQRNAGYGHPLRPEYVLNAQGARLARAAALIMPALSETGIQDAVLRRWALAVLHLVAFGQDRFSLIRAGLPRLTPRALATTLRRLEDANLVKRVVEHTYPPSVRYTTARGARRVLAALVPTT